MSQIGPVDSRIDFSAQQNLKPAPNGGIGYTNLTPYQCDVAIAIWLKLGVFDNESTTVINNNLDQFREDNIWRATFRNVPMMNEQTRNKLYQFTTQIITRYKDNNDFSGVDRINNREGSPPNQTAYNIICKPSASAALTTYKRNVGTAATTLVKAEKTNEAFALGHRTFNDMLQRTEKNLPNLMDRARFRHKLRLELENKDAEDMKKLQMMNGAVCGLPGATLTPEEQKELEKLCQRTGKTVDLSPVKKDSKKKDEEQEDGSA